MLLLVKPSLTLLAQFLTLIGWLFVLLPGMPLSHSVFSFGRPLTGLLPDCARDTVISSHAASDNDFEDQNQDMVDQLQGSHHFRH